MGGQIIARGLGLGVAALLLNVLIAFGWVYFYSVALAPGHEGGFYQAYAQRVAPIAAILAGIPLLFAAGWLAAAGARPLQAAMLPAGGYLLLDLALSAIGGLWPAAGALAIPYLTKFAAAWAGGQLKLRRRAVQ